MKTHPKRTSIKTDAGKLSLDLGKLVFGSVFLGSVLRGETSHVIMAIGGFAVATLFCVIGLFLLGRE
jgi:hypothetical protein